MMEKHGRLTRTVVAVAVLALTHMGCRSHEPDAQAIAGSGPNGPIRIVSIDPDLATSILRAVDWKTASPPLTPIKRTISSPSEAWRYLVNNMPMQGSPTFVAVHTAETGDRFYFFTGWAWGIEKADFSKGVVVNQGGLWWSYPKSRPTIKDNSFRQRLQLL